MKYNLVAQRFHVAQLINYCRMRKLSPGGMALWKRLSVFLVQVPIEKGRKNWQCDGCGSMTPAQHRLGARYAGTPLGHPY
jgi:hypothetical protein